MNKILKKIEFSSLVTGFVVEAPEVARSCRAGHFVIVRIDYNTKSRHLYQQVVRPQRRRLHNGLGRSSGTINARSRFRHSGLCLRRSRSSTYVAYL